MMYVLDHHTPVPTTDAMAWGKLFNDPKYRTVKKDVIGDILVSTVFLGLDHGYGSGKPVLFETMIFGGDHDDYQVRYCTWEEAEAGHERAIKLIQKSIGP